MAASSTKLSRTRILQMAMALADRGGASALTMRSLAKALHVTPMSIYRHINGKEALLDAMVEAVHAEMGVPQVGGDWRAEIFRHAQAMRSTLGAHPWALPLVDSRVTPGAQTLRRQDAAIGTFMEAGFSAAQTNQALVTLDAFVYGFVQQEASLPFSVDESPMDTVAEMVEHMPMDDYPYLSIMATTHIMTPNFRFSDMFTPGLNMILDGLARSLNGQ